MIVLLYAFCDRYVEDVKTTGARRRPAGLTLPQDFEPFGNRTTGMMKAQIGSGACREEEQIH